MSGFHVVGGEVPHCAASGVFTVAELQGFGDGLVVDRQISLLYRLDGAERRRTRQAQWL